MLAIAQASRNPMMQQDLERTGREWRIKRERGIGRFAPKRFSIILDRPQRGGKENRRAQIRESLAQQRRRIQTKKAQPSGVFLVKCPVTFIEQFRQAAKSQRPEIEIEQRLPKRGGLVENKESLRSLTELAEQRDQLFGNLAANKMIVSHVVSCVPALFFRELQETRIETVKDLCAQEVRP